VIQRVGRVSANVGDGVCEKRDERLHRVRGTSIGKVIGGCRPDILVCVGQRSDELSYALIVVFVGRVWWMILYRLLSYHSLRRR
jgi:hypothetical protein